MSCLVTALALPVDTVTAVADGAVHAKLLARVVLALGSANARSWKHMRHIDVCSYARLYTSDCLQIIKTSNNSVYEDGCSQNVAIL